MKKFFRTLAACVSVSLAMIVSGCDKNSGDDGGNDNSVFRLSIIETDYNAATAAVICNLSGEQNTWLSFCSEDLETPAADLVALKIVELQSAGTLSASLQWGNKPVEYTGLTAQTEYRAIAAGVLADGSVYGQISEARFTTGRDRSILIENEAWTPEYLGRKYDEEYPLQIYEVMSVDAGDSEDSYITYVVTKSDFDAIGTVEQGIKAYTEDAIDYYQTEIDRALMMGYTASWADVLVTGDTEDYYSFLDPGDYYLLVLGIDMDGKSSGYYACTPFSVKAVDGTSEYNSYIGTWTCSNEADADPEKVATITVSPAYFDRAGNKGAYIIEGWQTFWYEASAAGETSEWVVFPSFAAYFDAPDPENEPDGRALVFIGGSFDTYYYGGLGLYGTAGSIDDSDADKFSVVGGNIAVGTPDAGGESFTVSGLDVRNGNEIVSVENMEYLLVDSQGVATYKRAVPSLPFKMTPAQAADNAATVGTKLFSAGKLPVRQFPATETAVPSFMIYR